MPSNRILFVNKTVDSKSLSQSEGLEKARIFSHVRPLPASKSKDKRSDVSSSSTARRTHKVSNESDRSRKQITARPPCSHTIPAQVSSKLDCFNCTIVPMDPYMHDIFGHFRSTIFRSFCTVSTSAQTVLDCTLSYCASHAEVLYSVLCTAAITTFAQSNDDRHMRGFVYFKDRALHHLQETLRQVEDAAPSIPTVYAVSLLLYLECGQGDLEGARVHWKGLQQMVKTIETNVEDVPRPIYNLIIACAGFCSAMMASRPIQWPLPNPSNLDRGLRMMEIDDEETETVDVTLSSFCRESNKLFLGPKLSEISTELREVVLFRTRREGEMVSPSEADLDRVNASNLAIEQKLLSMPFEDGTMTPERNAVRLCIYFVSRPNITLTNPEYPFASSIAQQIKEALQQSTLSPAWRQCPDLHLWVLIIAGHASYEQEDWSWFVEQAATVIQAMDISSLEALEDVLSGYIMPSRPIFGLLQGLWNEVQIILGRSSSPRIAEEQR